MPRRTIALLSVMCAVLLLGACKGTPTVFDKSLPMEESVHIYIEDGIEIISYNGISVPVKQNHFSNMYKPDGIKSEWHNIALPPGEVEFVLNIGIKRPYSDTLFYEKDLLFRYTFEPSGDFLYNLIFTNNGGTDKNEWGINIHKSTGIMLFSAEDLIAFVPFLKLR